MSTEYGLRKVKEFMQGIDVYTNVTSSIYIQRGSLSMGLFEGDGHKNTHNFLVSCDEHKAEGEQSYATYNENTTLTAKLHMGT